MSSGVVSNFLACSTQALLQRLAVELELLRGGVELAAPALLQRVLRPAEHALLAEVGPARDRRVALQRLLRHPERRAGDLGGDLGELALVRRRLAGLGILELLRVVVEEVREALRLQLGGEQPHHLGLFLLDVPQALDRRLLDRRVAVAVAHVRDDRPALGRVERGRQHDVGELRHLGRVGDHVHEERHLRHRLVPALRAGAGEVEVVPRGHASP